jgi:hypothetical protein
MTEQSRFGVLLERLARRRELDIAGLSRSAQVSETELRAVFGGATPSSSLLRRIAPVLSLHTADFFAMAGLPVPDDLAPLDTKASSFVDTLVRITIRLSLEQRRKLREYVRSLPQHERGQGTQTPLAYEQYVHSPGAILVRMLSNRNLDWSSSVRILFRLAGVGPLSASTVGAIGHGRKELSSELLVGFATVLAIPVDDLAALAGIGLDGRRLPENPEMIDMGELIWDVRRLTADQIRQVCDTAKAESVAE